MANTVGLTTEPPPSRQRSLAHHGLRLARRLPFTIGVVGLVVVTGAFTAFQPGDAGARAQAWGGAGVIQLALDGHWWSLLSSIFLTGSPAEYAGAVVAASLFIGVAERLMGSFRTALAFFVTGMLGTALGVLVQFVGDRAGELWSSESERVVSLDPLTAISGALMTSSAFAGALWRRRIRVLTVIVSLVFVLYSGQPSDLYRLVAVGLGLVLGNLLAGPSRKPGWVRSSHHEVRVLLASTVAITATGPAISLLSASRFGPLAPIRLLFSNGVPTASAVAARCQVFDVTRQCTRDLALVRIDGLGPILLSLFPLVVLLVAAYGLLRASRFAVWLAASVNGMLAVLAAYYFGLLPLAARSAGGSGHAPHRIEIVLSLVLSVMLPLATAVVLIVLRSHFPSLATSRQLYNFVLVVGAALVVLSAFYIGAGFILRESAFTRTVSEGDLLGDVVERFIPVNFLVHKPPSFLPATPVGRWLYDGIGPLFWLVVALAAFPPLRQHLRIAGGVDAARARSLLRDGSGDGLAFMTTWRGNSYWFDQLSDLAIAYRVVNGIAITVGGPFGTEPLDPGCLLRFASFCDDAGWMPVFYSVQHRFEPFFAELGWETAVVADEAIIDSSNWNTAGAKWQDVRTSIHRAHRLGLRAEWSTYAALPLGAANQIAEICEQWVAQKALPELGFTLGGLDELRDPEVRVMVAIDGADRVHAVTSWLPRYERGHVAGYTLDVMRRRPESANGVMEFLIAETAMRLQTDGVPVMSLSGTPLAHAKSSGRIDRRDSVLERLSSSLEPVYGFRSLLRFKSKFQPEFLPLIMGFPDAAALPRIGIALARAYLPELSVARARVLIRYLG